jgi:hypothetical protein
MRRVRVLSAALVLASVAVSVWTACEISDSGQGSDLRRLERELARRDSVPAIQAWLLEHPEGPLRDAILGEVTEWPACIRELRALRARRAENGGVRLELSRGFSLTVYPRGQRPRDGTPESPAGRHLFLRAVGDDAYIARAER